MGTTRWSDDHYRDRAKLRARTGKDAFEYDHAIRNGAADRAVHPKMNPRGVKVRESRDSAAHPESHQKGAHLRWSGIAAHDGIERRLSLALTQSPALRDMREQYFEVWHLGRHAADS